MAITRSIAVFGASGSQPGDGHYEEAVRCGALIARAGFTVVTGGYGGTMEGASKGARSVGGEVIGVTAPEVFTTRSGANQHITVETRASSLIERIGYLIDGTAGSLALWGSLGTATELLVAWNLAYVAPFADRPRKPVVAVGEPWLTLVPHLEETLDTASGLVYVTTNIDDAVSRIVSSLS
jgi:uncharacterized protein (TIGR00725 family)